MKKRKAIYSVLTISLFFFTMGCYSDLQREVSTYDGAGDMKYLSNNSLLGLASEGYYLKLPPFDLSKKGSFSYNLSHMPKAAGSVKLVIPFDGKKSPCVAAIEVKLNDESGDLLAEFNYSINRDSLFYEEVFGRRPKYGTIDFPYRFNEALKDGVNLTLELNYSPEKVYLSGEGFIVIERPATM